MNCPAPEDLLAYRQGELAESERSAIASHASACTACARELNRLERTLRAIRAVEVIEPPVDFAERIADAIVAQTSVSAAGEQVDPAETAWEKFLAWTRLEHTPAWAISAAAHLLLFAVLAYMFVPSVTVQAPIDPGLIVELVPYEAPARPAEPPVSTAPDESVVSTLPEPSAPNPVDNGETGEPRNPERQPVGQVATPHQKPPSGGDAPTEIAVPPEPLPWLPPMPEHFDRRPFDAPVKASAKAGAKASPLSKKFQDELDKRFFAYIPLRIDPDKRRAASEKFGGGAETERAVRDGLFWLQQQQRPDGTWPVPALKSDEEYRVGVTALAALAFLGHGETHRSGPMAPVVEKALAALAAEQASDGRFGPAGGHVLYNHAIATIVFLEAAQISGDVELRDRAVLGTRYILDAQNFDGGWGYTTKSNLSDSSVTGWQVMALRLAQGFNIPEVSKALANAGHWLQEVTNNEGRVGYRVKGNFPNGSNALTAAGLWCRELIGSETADPVLDHQQVAHLLAAAPVWHGPGGEMENDFTFWYHGSLALFQRGGDDWTTWNTSLRKALIEGRVSEGADAGSWPPADRWSGYGGPVYATAMAILALETPWRYPVFVK